ncbi:lasso peptide biosynthesis B2 protein [[Pseudomonas] boreopolis]|uniref:lasso peptide biosynthesis B2 protein n=1 Tax=Xanthomonas boreopolis TaxID=86183 RepID=UPI003D9FF221
MRYLVNGNLSWCDIDGHLVFLDVAQDRYFRLADTLELALRRFLALDDVPAEQLEILVRKGILVDGQDPRSHARMPDIPRPTRSAFEMAAMDMGRRPSLPILAEVLTIVLWARRQLKQRPLGAILENATAYRSRRTSACANAVTAPDHVLLDAAARFACARRYVPVEPRCLWIRCPCSDSCRGANCPQTSCSA